MKKILLGYCLLFTSIFVFSQEGTFLQDITGKPYMLKKYSKVVEGSAFFKEQFLRGDVILNNGYEFKNQQLKLNLLENLLNYRNDRQQEMISTATVKEVVLTDSLAGRQYRFVYSDFLDGSNKPDRGWYEQLYLGKATLLKQYKKELMEKPLYGSASVELSISTQQRYYIIYAGEWQWVKKIKNLPEILHIKKNELQKFIKEQKLNTETEENFIALVHYYNSLQ